MTRILALDAALARCSAAVVVDGVSVADRRLDAARGHAALLPRLAHEVMAEAALTAASFDVIAVTVGPGSFTGLRTGLALAHGLSLAAGVKLVGVSVGEALAEALPQLGSRELWSAIDSQRGRVFLERNGSILAIALADLPRPQGPVAIAGDAAIAVAARLAARDADVMLTDARLPVARHVALAALRRLAGALPPRDGQPIYVDPPEARLPAAGPRPAHRA
jgi:tRNA threonylcarbamoyladenosine biosynthesis protein TsaB